jgi:arylsulfatase A-like enzyme
MKSKQSNILLLFTDQQRFDTIAALGNPIIKTPAMDRLVREGTAFTRCYTPSPVCISGRCSMITGQPAHITGCTDNVAQPQNLSSFMEHLRDAGYQTHGTGKMHFSPDPLRMWGYESRDVAEEVGFPYVPGNREEVLNIWNCIQNRYKWRDNGSDGNRDTHDARRLYGLYFFRRLQHWAGLGRIGRRDR